MSEQTGTATPPAPVTEIPQFKNADGTFASLKPKDFPRTREGRKALCQYRAAVYDSISKEWLKKAEDIDHQDDPKHLRQRRIEKLRAQLAALEKDEAQPVA